MIIFVQLSLTKECEKKNINQYIQSKKCCSQAQPWHQKICRTQLWEKKSMWEKKLQTNNYMYYCILSTWKNNKQVCYYKLQKTICHSKILTWKSQKNTHKRDSWHSCDIRRSIAHNYDNNLCEKIYGGKMWQKQKYVHM